MIPYQIVSHIETFSSLLLTATYTVLQHLVCKHPAAIVVHI